MKTTKAEREEAVRQLREYVKPGDTIYTILRKVSRSGMNRKIDVMKIEGDRTWRLTHLVAQAAGFNIDKQSGTLSVGGCGIDMGFHVVYALSSILFRDSFVCIGEGCPANDHSNGDRDYQPHKHSDGGYALKQRWL